MAETSEAFLCRITNPTPRARIIYDGITNAKAIRIAPGATADRVVLSDATILRLQDAELRDPDEPNLKVVELGPAPAAAPPRAQRTRNAAPSGAPTGAKP